MKNAATFDELREVIVDALLAGTVEEEYPLWLYDCRMKYGISSYTLQVLINFYKSRLSEPDILVPHENSNHFVTCERVYMEDIVYIGNREERRPQSKCREWILFISAFWILLMSCCIIICCNEYGKLENESKNEKIQLQEEIKSLKISLSTTDSLYDKVLNMNHTIGASRKDMQEHFDSSWLMWLSVKHPLKITSFYIKANNNGMIKLGLYDSKSKLISSAEVRVYKDVLKLVEPSNFIVSTPGLYYLGIEKSNNISLCYHSSSSMEYRHFKDDALQIIACEGRESVKSKKHNGHRYYQYFYDITYKLMRKNLSKPITFKERKIRILDSIYNVQENKDSIKWGP